MLGDHLMQFFIRIQLILLKIFLNQLHPIRTALLLQSEFFEARIEDGDDPLLNHFPRPFLLKIGQSFGNDGGSLLGFLGQAINLTKPKQ